LKARRQFISGGKRIGSDRLVVVFFTVDTFGLNLSGFYFAQSIAARSRSSFFTFSLL
jgi:hypothetical protein